MPDPRVAAVVVTWNRRDLLVEALDAVLAQTVPVEVVVVVDNASDDGSGDLVAERYADAATALDLVRLPVNTGGAGGFAAGVDRALTAYDVDALWLLDDDTVPTPTALEELLAVRGALPRPPAVLASRVVWTDGRDHPMNTPRPSPWASPARRREARAVGAVAIRSASFVSVLCDAATTRASGGPVADYFLWNDDFEMTTRLVRAGGGVACPHSVVVHKTRTFGSTDADPGERFYYEVRNKVWVFTRSHGLRPPEKLVYAGATLRRWARTWRGSSDRAVLRRALVRGLRDGVRTRPGGVCP